MYYTGVVVLYLFTFGDVLLDSKRVPIESFAAWFQHSLKRPDVVI